MMGKGTKKVKREPELRLPITLYHKSLCFYKNKKRGTLPPQYLSVKLMRVDEDLGVPVITLESKLGQSLAPVFHSLKQVELWARRADADNVDWITDDDDASTARWLLLDGGTLSQVSGARLVNSEDTKKQKQTKKTTTTTKSNRTHLEYTPCLVPMEEEEEKTKSSLVSLADVLNGRSIAAAAAGVVADDGFRLRALRIAFRQAERERVALELYPVAVAVQDPSNPAELFLSEWLCAKLAHEKDRRCRMRPGQRYYYDATWHHDTIRQAQSAWQLLSHDQRVKWGLEHVVTHEMVNAEDAAQLLRAAEKWWRMGGGRDGRLPLSLTYTTHVLNRGWRQEAHREVAALLESGNWIHSEDPETHFFSSVEERQRRYQLACENEQKNVCVAPWPTPIPHQL